MKANRHFASSTLCQAKPWQPYRVTGLLGNEDSQQRLASLGFVRGAEVTVLQRVAGGAKVRVNGFNLAMDGNSLAQILVDAA